MRLALQAPAWRAIEAWRHRVLPAAALFGLSAALVGCGAGAVAETDAAVVSSVAPQARGDAQHLSDATTIRNAVSSADMQHAAARPISWANAATGSRGAISALEEKTEDGRLCRNFTTTRESFEGIALYQGKACMVQPGAWHMQAFAAL